MTKYHYDYYFILFFWSVSLQKCMNELIWEEIKSFIASNRFLISRSCSYVLHPKTLPLSLFSSAASLLLRHHIGEALTLILHGLSPAPGLAQWVINNVWLSIAHCWHGEPAAALRPAKPRESILMRLA